MSRPRRTPNRPITRSQNRSHAVTSYWDRTQWPLQSLYFLLPLIVGYELGTVLYAPEGGERLPAIYAERLLGRFFEVFGVTGYYLPGVLAVAVLLGMHVVRRDPWKPEPKLYAAMAVESLLLAVPLFIMGSLLSGTPAPGSAGMGGGAALEMAAGGGASGWPMAAAWLQGSPAVVDSWQSGLVFSVGAGIYEELMFRLIAIVVLHLLLDDLLALPRPVSKWGAIIGSAVLFAMYHFGEHNPFDAGRFAFYTLAGAYFAVVYVSRGFGIVAATHAIYDILAITTHLQQ